MRQMRSDPRLCLGSRCAAQRALRARGRGLRWRARRKGRLAVASHAFSLGSVATTGLVEPLREASDRLRSEGAPRAGGSQSRPRQGRAVVSSSGMAVTGPWVATAGVKTSQPESAAGVFRSGISGKRAHSR